MLCKVCGKEISEDETYTYEGKRMCEECAIGEGLFPLGHTGLRRDKISEKGRYLTLPKSIISSKPFKRVCAATPGS